MNYFCKVTNCNNKICKVTALYGTGYCAYHAQKNRKHLLDCQCAPCRSKRGEYKGKNNAMYGRKGKDSPFFGKKHTRKSKNKMRKSLNTHHIYHKYNHKLLYVIGDVS